MLESADYVTNNKLTLHQNSLGGLRYMFLIVACAYMLPWTSLGSLVHYFSIEYGNEYFVILNIAFYGVGLPITYLQRAMDNYYDVIYGSKSTFRYRVFGCLALSAGCLLFVPFCEYYGIIAVTLVIGICTWVSHGCTTTLSGMVKYHSSIMQQIGFALPAVFGITMTLLLHLSNPTPSDIYVYFYTTTVMMIPGIVAWKIICKSSSIKDLLRQKDAKLGELLISTAKASLQSCERSFHDLDDITSVNTPFLHDDQESAGGGYSSLSQDDMAKSVLSDGRASLHDEAKIQLQDSVASASVTTYNTRLAQESPTTFDLLPRMITVDLYADDCGTAASLAYDHEHMILSKNINRILDDSRKLLKLNPKFLAMALCSKQCAESTLIHRQVLFINIFCSILQGSFISYTTGCEINGVQLPFVLYFIRIFADLIGRPMALLPTPGIFNNINKLYLLVILRCLSMFYFFAIASNLRIFTLDFLQSPYCHYSLIAFQAVFSFFSGYINCLTYEYSTGIFVDEWRRVIASQYLNLTFQKACSAAVAAALLIIVFINYLKKPLGLGSLGYN